MQDATAAAPEQAATTEGKLYVTSDRLRAWNACTDGYRWFAAKYPQGGLFAAVYAALRDERRYSDAEWLTERVFADLECGDRVRQTVLIAIKADTWYRLGADGKPVEVAE